MTAPGPTGERAGRRRLALSDPPWIVAHRGASAHRLENTPESCRLAVEAGADMVEVDVQLTADGELVACHDSDLRRLAATEIVVEESRAAEVVGRRLALERDGRRLEGRLAHLDEILDAVPPDFPINVEAKRRTARLKIYAARLADLAAARERLLVSSSDLELLEELRRLDPTLPLAPVGARDAARLVETAQRLDAWGVHCERQLFRLELVGAAAPRPVLVYTVNDGATARQLVAWRAAGLFTDDPALVCAALEAL